MSIKKWPKNALSWFFMTRFWIFVRLTKIAITRPIFKIFVFFFLHGASLFGYDICFWYHSNPTWNDWDMAKICSAGVFAPPPESSALDPPWILVWRVVQTLKVLKTSHMTSARGPLTSRNCFSCLDHISFCFYFFS